MYSLDALQAAVSEAIDIPNQKRTAQNMIKDTEETIARMAAGKFTFTGMLKNEKEKKEAIIVKEEIIAQLKIDVSNFDIIRRMLIIYLATVAVPQYKKQAKERYIKQMGLMCRSEVANAASLTNCWGSFKSLIDSFNIKEWFN